ncbi:DUF4838 domain-containing protein [Hansschlegelia plantiphila]|uniref:DUF4838 domain-containing protein n=1 Tax=Hansschlegelia plantiphila TaxID=374655 RepID=A0A9W6MWN0_9HYPH|nr:DUF4838 domain-containing protein [Hansschlegelia plantiphila]GLK69714.1 hypothetical protein GCM10008179_33520 [Hansschlegelia plantiphila]
MLRFRPAAVAALALCLSLIVASPAAAGNYGGKIAAAADIAASPALAPAIADLKLHLSKMTSTPFEVVDQTAAPAVRLMIDPARRGGPVPDLDTFRIKGDDAALTISSGGPQGLSNGVYFYLEQLGVRWLMPGDDWIVTPRRADVTLTIDRTVTPSFAVRTYAGTGGFFSRRWSRNYAGSAAFRDATTDWKRRLRYGGSYQLGKAVGETFMADPKILPILEAHPDYLASVGGKSSPIYVTKSDGASGPNVTAKINAGNAEAVKLFCSWAIDRFRAARAGGDPATQRVMSVEPSDGFGYGDNAADLPGNGSGSDQSFFIANECAREVRKEFPGTSVILLAYAGHAEPPSFPLEPNVIVQVAPYAFQEVPPQKFIADWTRKANEMAIYDYWSIPDWARDEPSFNYLTLAERLRYWRASKIDGVAAETTFGLGAMGLGHYIAAHLMWDVDQDAGALIDDWFETAFGPARPPMRRMMDRWATSFTLTSLELGRTFQDLAEARRLAGADPAVGRRIDDFVAYAHYLRLRLELDGESDPAERTLKAHGIVQHLLDANGSMMMHTTRLVDLLARKYPTIYADFGATDRGLSGPGWLRVRPLDAADAERLLEDGLRRYPAQDVALRTYSGELQLAPSNGGFAPSPAMPVVGSIDFNLTVPAGRDRFRLSVSRRVASVITIFDTERREVDSRVVSKTPAGAPASDQELDFALDPGRYVVNIHPDGGRKAGYVTFRTEPGAAVTLRTFLSPKSAPSPRLYFFVPPGLKRLAIYYPLGVFEGVRGFNVFRPDGVPAPIDFQDGRRVLLIDVPHGADGKIWSLTRSVSPNEPFRMLNAPQAFSLSPNTLMIPRDAL